MLLLGYKGKVFFGKTHIIIIVFAEQVSPINHKHDHHHIPVGQLILVTKVRTLFRKSNGLFHNLFSFQASDFHDIIHVGSHSQHFFGDLLGIDSLSFFLPCIMASRGMTLKASPLSYRGYRRHPWGV